MCIYTHLGWTGLTTALSVTLMDRFPSQCRYFNTTLTWKHNRITQKVTIDELLPATNMLIMQTAGQVKLSNLHGVRQVKFLYCSRELLPDLKIRHCFQYSQQYIPKTTNLPSQTELSLLPNLTPHQHSRSQHTLPGHVEAATSSFTSNGCVATIPPPTGLEWKRGR